MYCNVRVTCFTSPLAEKYKPQGCFKDSRSRAIPYSGHNFPTETAVQQCGMLAASKGYKAFGVQNRDECYTGPDAHITYHKYGKTSDGDCSNGVGGWWRNNIYLTGEAGLLTESCVRLRIARFHLLLLQCIQHSHFNPFTPESDRCQISPAASASILHRIVWRT